MAALPHLVLGGAELDAARLAAGAGVDLRLHRPARAADLRGPIDRLLGAVRHPAARDGDAEVGEEFLGLVFVDVHRSLLVTRRQPGARRVEPGLSASLPALPAIALAISTTFCAIRALAASIIRPSSWAAPFPSLRRLLQRLEDPPGPVHLRLGRGEDLVGQLDLRGVDGPLPLDAERRAAPGGEQVAIGILEVAERARRSAGARRRGRPRSSGSARRATGRPDSRG